METSKKKRLEKISIIVLIIGGLFSLFLFSLNFIPVIYSNIHCNHTHNCPDNEVCFVGTTADCARMWTLSEYIPYTILGAIFLIISILTSAIVYQIANSKYPSIQEYSRPPKINTAPSAIFAKISFVLSISLAAFASIIPFLYSLAWSFLEDDVIEYLFSLKQLIIAVSLSILALILSITSSILNSKIQPKNSFIKTMNIWTFIFSLTFCVSEFFYAFNTVLIPEEYLIIIVPIIFGVEIFASIISIVKAKK